MLELCRCPNIYGPDCIMAAFCSFRLFSWPTTEAFVFPLSYRALALYAKIAA